jgi:hypothetical protein
MWSRRKRMQRVRDWVAARVAADVRRAQAQEDAGWGDLEESSEDPWGNLRVGARRARENRKNVPGEEESGRKRCQGRGARSAARPGRDRGHGKTRVPEGAAENRRGLRRRERSIDGFAGGAVAFTIATTSTASTLAQVTCDRVRFPRSLISRGVAPVNSCDHVEGDGALAVIGD